MDNNQIKRVIRRIRKHINKTYIKSEVCMKRIIRNTEEMNENNDMLGEGMSHFYKIKENLSLEDTLT